MKTLKRILMKIGFLILAAACFWMTYINISSGRINSKFGGYITAADSPRQYRFSIAFGVFVSIVFIFAAISKGEDN